MSEIHSQRFVTLVNDARTRVAEITPRQVREKLEDGEEFKLFDVREQEE